jgi:hypothetical protein
MDPKSIKLGEDGIPLLDEPLSVEQLPPPDQSPAAGLTDEEQIDRLLREEQLQGLLEDLTEDLVKLMSWKMESFLKEELLRLVHQAAEKSAPRLATDIRTQLELALPELVARLNRQARDRSR